MTYLEGSKRSKTFPLFPTMGDIPNQQHRLVLHGTRERESEMDDDDEKKEDIKIDSSS